METAELQEKIYAFVLAAKGKKKLKEKDQVKVVIADDNGFEFMKEILKKTSVEVILQPAGGLNLKRIAEKVVDEKLDVRVLPQLHKILDVR